MSGAGLISPLSRAWRRNSPTRSRADETVLVADDIQRPTAEMDAITVGDEIAARIDLLGVAGPRVQAEQETGIRLDDDEPTAAGGDAVRVEARVELEVAGEWHEERIRWI